MSTFFINPAAGNDASAGTSFATAWKTFTNGATLARLTAGDLVKVMESPDLADCGITADWTHGSNHLTLASPLTKTVHSCNTAFTAATNVTATTSADRRQGTASASMAIAGAFTTGKIAYAASANANYSTYMQLTFMIKSDIDIAANTLQLALCSDGIGAVIVNSVTIAETLKAGAWTPVTISTGGALGAAIASVAFYALLDPGVATILLDNIEAALDPTDDASLSLNSFIVNPYPGSPLGFETLSAVESILGTAVILGRDAQVGTPDSLLGYDGPTVTSELFKCEYFTTDLIGDATTKAAELLQAGVTFSGGWDRGSMTTQNGKTRFDGRNGFGVGLYATGKANISLDHFYFSRYYNGLIIDACATFTLSNCSADNSTGDNAVFTNDNTGLSLERLFTSAGAGKGIFLNCLTTGALLTNVLLARSNAGDGINIPRGSVSPAYVLDAPLSTVMVTRNGGFGINGGGVARLWNSILAADNASAALNTASQKWGPLTINAIESSGHPSMMMILSAQKIRILSATCSDTAIVDMNGNSSSGVDSCIHNIDTVPSIPVINFDPDGMSNTRVRFQTIGGNKVDSRIYTDGGSIITQAVVVDGTYPVARKFSSTKTWITSDFPLDEIIKEVGTIGGGTITFTARVRRSSSSIHARLKILGGRGLTSIPIDITAAADGSPGSFANYTVSATIAGSDYGVVQLMLEVWGGTTDSVYLSNVTAVQA